MYKQYTNNNIRRKNLVTVPIIISKDTNMMLVPLVKCKDNTIQYVTFRTPQSVPNDLDYVLKCTYDDCCKRFIHKDILTTLSLDDPFTDTTINLIVLGCEGEFYPHVSQNYHSAHWMKPQDIPANNRSRTLNLILSSNVLIPYT